MTAQIFDLSDALARERRNGLRLVAPTSRRADCPPSFWRPRQSVGDSQRAAHETPERGAKNPPHIPLADLIANKPFAVTAGRLQPIREVILFAIAAGAFAEAQAAIEEFIALPVADDDAGFCRDSLALGFAAVLQQRAQTEAEDDAAGAFFDRIANSLFPIRGF